jgi:hypothetical protein
MRLIIRGDGDMGHDDKIDEPNGEPERDPGLSRCLAVWRVPETTAALDERLLAAYRRRYVTAPFWKRMMTMSVRVPLPVAGAFVLALVFAIFWIVSRPTSVPVRSYAAGSSMRADSGSGAPIVTSFNLDGFQPVEEVSLSVVSEGPLTP